MLHESIYIDWKLPIKCHGKEKKSKIHTNRCSCKVELIAQSSHTMPNGNETEKKTLIGPFWFYFLYTDWDQNDTNAIRCRQFLVYYIDPVWWKIEPLFRFIMTLSYDRHTNKLELLRQQPHLCASQISISFCILFEMLNNNMKKKIWKKKRRSKNCFCRCFVSLSLSLIEEHRLSECT